MKPRTYEVSTTITDPIGNEVDGLAVVEVSGRDTKPYFSRSFGNWLPGESCDAEIVGFTDEDGKDMSHLLDRIGKAGEEWVIDRALELDAEAALDAQAEAEDFAYECERDRRMGLD